MGDYLSQSPLQTRATWFCVEGIQLGGKHVHAVQQQMCCRVDIAEAQILVRRQRTPGHSNTGRFSGVISGSSTVTQVSHSS